MADYKVIPYSKDYLPGVRALWEEQYEPSYVEIREKLFKWFTEENPFLTDESPYFIVLEGDTVVGLWGHMPVKYSVKGKRYDGYMSQDALLSKKTRGKGIGKVVLKEIRAQRDSFAGALWFNEPNFRLYSKCDWMEVPGLYPQVKIIKPLKYFKRKFNSRFLSIFFAIVFTGLNLATKGNKIFLSSPKKYRIVEINDFSEEFDSFFDFISYCFGIIVERDSRYLNWKFVDKPFNAYRRFAAYDSEGELCGYIVFKVENNNLSPKGKILDFLVHPENQAVFDLLINQALGTFSDSEVHFVEILCTLPKFQSILKRRGFVRARKPQRFMINDWNGLFLKGLGRNIQNWFITFADADGDAWD